LEVVLLYNLVDSLLCYLYKNPGEGLLCKGLVDKDLAAVELGKGRVLNILAGQYIHLLVGRTEVRKGRWRAISYYYLKSFGDDMLLLDLHPREGEGTATLVRASPAVDNRHSHLCKTFRMDRSPR
jgi:hypothetical protein